MFAQYIVSILIVFGALYLFWNFYAKDFLITTFPDFFIEVNPEELNERILELQKRKEELETLQVEVKATEELVEVEGELKKLSRIKKKLDKKLD